MLHVILWPKVLAVTQYNKETVVLKSIKIYFLLLIMPMAEQVILRLINAYINNYWYIYLRHVSQGVGMVTKLHDSWTRSSFCSLNYIYTVKCKRNFDLRIQNNPNLLTKIETKTQGHKEHRYYFYMLNI